MTDKELLEKAAKAAGYSVNSDGEGGLTITVRRGVCRGWDPLGDDGDALRLAVKLGLKIERHDEYYPYFSAEKKSVIYVVEDVIKNKNDEFRTVRHAIVRAAAALGDA